MVQKNTKFYEVHRRTLNGLTFLLNVYLQKDCTKNKIFSNLSRKLARSLTQRRTVLFELHRRKFCLALNLLPYQKIYSI